MTDADRIRRLEQVIAALLMDSLGRRQIRIASVDVDAKRGAVELDETDSRVTVTYHPHP